MKYIIAYVKSTINYGIIYHYRTSLQSVGFVDSDYANNQNTRRSIDGHVFYVGKELIL